MATTLHAMSVRALALAPVLVLCAPDASACAVCATADPTLTVAGEEQPFRGRLRIDVDVRQGAVSAGDVSLDDRRAEIAVLWAPVRALEVSFAAPYLFRHIESFGGASDEATMGDIELRAQVLAYESRGAFGRRRFGLIGGLKLPTAPLGYDPRGALLASTLQPGCGSIAPTLGAYYATSHKQWSTYASGSLFLPFSVRDGPHSSDSARLALHAQFQPHPRFAGRLGAFVRIDASGQLAPSFDDPNSGGLIGYLTGAIVVSPVSDLVVTAGIFLPVIEAFRGTHHESAIAALTLAHDF
jgi:hypothetical protein